MTIGLVKGYVMIKNAIYRILNTVDGKCYVGQASHYEQRIAQHFAALRKGKHKNYLLQAAYDQYGVEAFRVTIIEDGIPDYSLCDRERHWIWHFRAQSEGYNLVRVDEKDGDAQSASIVEINIELGIVKREIYLVRSKMVELYDEVHALERREKELTITRRQLRKDMRG